MRVLLVVCAALVASCYSPKLRDCELTCASGVCPNGFDCHDNMCRAPGASGSCVDDAGTDADDADAIDALVDGSPDEDTDMDGANDAIDNCRFISNVDQANEDMDEFGDACDRCPPHDGAANIDSDGDGVGDGCDPFPQTAGESIRLFVGFATPPTDTLTVGQAGVWTFPNGRARVATAMDQMSAMLWNLTFPAGRREYVSSHVELVSFLQSDMARSAGVVMGYDINTNRSATCAFGLDPIGTPVLMILQTTVANDTIVTQEPNGTGAGSGANSDILVSKTPGGIGFTCTAPASTATGNPALTANSLRIGLRARGLTARFEWFMVVETPQP